MQWVVLIDGVSWKLEVTRLELTTRRRQATVDARLSFVTWGSGDFPLQPPSLYTPATVLAHDSAHISIQYYASISRCRLRFNPELLAIQTGVKSSKILNC